MKKIIKEIWHSVFGYKYYAINVDYMGYDSLSAEIFTSRKAAIEAKVELLKERKEYFKLHIISFRSRRQLAPEVINRNHVSYAKD